jgi:hypothetical protein
MFTEDFQGPQGAEVPRMQDPGVLQHRGAAGQPAAGAAPGWRALGAQLRETRLPAQAGCADRAGLQQKQDQPQKSTSQLFPAGAQCQNPHGWGKKHLACYYRVLLEVGCVHTGSQG